MKKFLVILSMLACHFTNAQQKVELSNIQGIVVSYKLSKIDSSDEKKDKYLASISAENQNEFDLFYTAQPTSGNALIVSDNFKVNFASVEVNNTKGFFADKMVKLQGQLSRLITLNGWMVYILPKKTVISQSLSFNVAKGETPVLSNKFYKRFNLISDLY